MKAFVLGASLLLAAFAFGQTNTTADHLRGLDKQMRDAALKGDSSLDEKYAATEYVAINPAGTLFTRDQILAQLKNSQVTLQSIDIDQEEVHVYGDTAVITGRERARGTFKGQAFDHSARYSRVWTKQGGDWKLVLFQETPLAQTAQ